MKQLDGSTGRDGSRLARGAVVVAAAVGTLLFTAHCSSESESPQYGLVYAFSKHDGGKSADVYLGKCYKDAAGKLVPFAPAELQYQTAADLSDEMNRLVYDGSYVGADGTAHPCASKMVLTEEEAKLRGLPFGGTLIGYYVVAAESQPVKSPGAK